MEVKTDCYNLTRSNEEKS